ncbi:MAG: hypothetical protein ABEK10_04335 [Candidatus Nanosalina sp.]
MDYGRVERFTEFLVIGVLLGTVEDLIAVKAATGEPITLQTIGIIIAVSIPFAAFSELVVDHPDTEIIRYPSSKIHSLANKIAK